MFINRGQEGLQKRKPLDETHAGPASTAAAPTDSGHIPPLARSPSSECLLEDQLISAFYESYASRSLKHPSKTADPAWLYHSLRITFPTETLRQALFSLACIRLGRLNDDQATVIKGHQVYGQALRLMQQALYDPILMRHEETLAAARCMILYEAFEATSENMTSWFNHIQGIARILELRGPRCHHSPLTQTILESTRYYVMIVGMMQRRPSFLGRAEWLTEPWVDGHKNFEQRYIDYGFYLSDLSHQGDSIISQDASADPVSRHVEFVQVLRGLQCGLDAVTALRKELLQISIEQARSCPPGNIDQNLCSVDFGEEAGTTITSATLNALDLSYSLFAAALLHRYRGHPSSEHDSVVSQFGPYVDQGRRLMLARQILQDLEACSHGSFEHIRARMIFPLNVLRWELRQHPEEFGRVNGLFDVIAGKSKYRIGRSVQKEGTFALPLAVVEGKANKCTSQRE